MVLPNLTMESITIKVDKNLANEIDQIVSSSYSTKTEFIRGAIRDKLKQREKEKLELIKELEKFKGAAKVHVSDEQIQDTREKIAKEYAKKFGIKLD